MSGGYLNFLVVGYALMRFVNIDQLRFHGITIE